MLHQINCQNLEQKNWIEINDQSRGVYSMGSDIWFKITMLKSSLCGYGDAYILDLSKQ